jgi:AGZA family xanthine/uracil permease-like MFS transporter
MASGLTIAVLCFLGMFGVLSAVLPIPAIVPILLYIGLLIGAQAFRAVPRIHAAAVVAAIVPNLASWRAGLIDNALWAAGTSAAQLGEGPLTNAGLVYHGLHLLGQGAVLAGIVFGAIVTFIPTCCSVWCCSASVRCVAANLPPPGRPRTMRTRRWLTPSDRGS